MSRTLRALGATLGLAVAATLVVAPANAITPGYYSAAYDDTILLHQHLADGAQTTGPILFQEWAAAGFPTPTPAPVEYVKYPWWPDTWAVHYFGADRWNWEWAYLTPERWSRAGQPDVRNANWIAETYFFSWASSPEVFAGLPVDGGPGYHKMTFAQWLAAGSPSPEVLTTAGFYRYPWSPSIGSLFDTRTGEGTSLTYAEWSDLGFPTPQTVTHVAGEVVWKKPGSSTLYLDSAITGNGFPLTYAQWTALGRPAPVVR